MTTVPDRLTARRIAEAHDRAFAWAKEIPRQDLDELGDAATAAIAQGTAMSVRQYRVAVAPLIGRIRSRIKSRAGKSDRGKDR